VVAEQLQAVEQCETVAHPIWRLGFVRRGLGDAQVVLAKEVIRQAEVLPASRIGGGDRFWRTSGRTITPWLGCRGAHTPTNA